MLSSDKFFYAFIVFYYTAILAVVVTTPITPTEAYYYYQPIASVVTYLSHILDFTNLSILGIRFPYFILGMLSSLLFYKVSRLSFADTKDARLSLMLYMLLPGIISSTIMANSAVVISLLLLLFVYGYLKEDILIYSLALLGMIFVHWSIIVILTSLVIYALLKKDYRLFVVAISLTILYFIFGIDFPAASSKNYILDTIAIHATILSPFMFVYMFYAIYRGLFHGKHDIVWFLPFVALFFSLVLSFRYKVMITDFSSYIMIGIITSLQSYLNSFRVRMPQFRKGYSTLLGILIATLVLSSLLVVLHQPLYRLLGKDNYSIAARIYEPYDISNKLKKENLHCIDNLDDKMLYQMRYYHIDKCF